MLTLLIVNYYSTELIGSLLQSLAESPIRQVVVVNNSPADPALHALTKTHALTMPLIVLQAPENLGFGRACNLGLNHIHQQDPTALVWMLNPDTQLHPGAAAYLLTCFQQHPTAAVVGTRIQTEAGAPWFSRGDFNPWVGSLPHTPPVDRSRPQAPPTLVPSRWVSGCSLVLNLGGFATCPQFDPGFFLYYEDNDLCERLYQAGYTLWVTEAILVTHAVSALTGRNPALKWNHATYGKLRFLRLHGRGIALPLNRVYLILRAALTLLRGDRSTAQGMVQGWRRAWHERHHPLEPTPIPAPARDVQSAS